MPFYLAPSRSVPGVDHRCTSYGCTCKGFEHYGRCAHSRAVAIVGAQESASLARPATPRSTALSRAWPPPTRRRPKPSGGHARPRPSIASSWTATSTDRRLGLLFFSR